MLSRLEPIQPQPSKAPSTATDLPLSFNNPTFPLELKDSSGASKITSIDTAQERNASGPRLFANSPDASQPNPTKQPGDYAVSPSSQPPAGSRLLAFARTPAKAAPLGNPANSLQSLNGQ